jgi:hypothetical protein
MSAARASARGPIGSPMATNNSSTAKIRPNCVNLRPSPEACSSRSAGRWHHGRVAGIPIPETARRLLDSDAVAQVVTIDEDGGPHVTAAWVGIEGDEIVLATLQSSASCGTSAAIPASPSLFTQPT